MSACSFWMYKNKEGDIVVKFHNEDFQRVQMINMKQEEDDTMIELQGTDYREERKDNKLVLTMYRETIQYIVQLAIALLDMEGKQKLFVVDNVNIACAHKYTNKESKFSLHTHNSDKVAAYIKSIISIPVLETNIQLFCCGEVQEKVEANI
ncbi:uncharacterized protein LOC130629527 [Hydractinia symbiolongicarpus]|uniref:uncharacterized protein LOC130629527 n=1 Tax=Hydractinia symbiolongicarpus TaxID=13093 RepID=UPI00254AE173|nr:uncharacterized protein LOC130629527 [Hydractinia symbiolongicarpus]